MGQKPNILKREYIEKESESEKKGEKDMKKREWERKKKEGNN